MSSSCCLTTRKSPSTLGTVLKPVEVMRFRGSTPAPLVLHCLEGTVWLTSTEDPNDIILEEGECVAVPRRGELLAQALRGDARVLLAAA